MEPRKKEGIVQGLLHEPKLIILDGPTGGLDSLMKQKFFGIIKEENEKVRQSFSLLIS